MATDNFCEMNETDGEDIAGGDISDISKFVGAKLRDQILAKLLPYIPVPNATKGDPDFPGVYGNSLGSNATAKARAIAISVGGAYPWVNGPDSGNGYLGGTTLGKNIVGIAPGTLLQIIGDENAGTDTNVLAYTFAGTETVAIAAGDVANPRVDLIQMQLATALTDGQSRDFQDAITGAYSSQVVNKKRRVQLTLNVKQGVANANPMTPTPDAGFCAVAQVYVPAGYLITTQIKPAHLDNGASCILMDDRMPLNVKAYRVDAFNMPCEPTAEWVADPTHTFRQASAAAKVIRAMCPKVNGRLVGVALESYLVAGAVVELYHVKVVSHVVTEDQLTFHLGLNLFSASTYNNCLASLDALNLKINFVAGGGVVAGGLRSDLTIGLGTPIWTSGCQAPVRAFEEASQSGGAGSANAGRGDKLELAITSNGNTDQVYSVTFYVAEGL